MRHVRSPIALFVALAFPLLCLGCSKLLGNPDGGQTASILGKIDLSGAAALAIVPTSGLSKGLASKDGATNTLAKVTADGLIVEATCYDDAGNQFTKTSGFSPNAVYAIDDTYLMVVFNVCLDSGKSSKNIGYLIRKTDGAAFSLENVGAPADDYYYLNEPHVWKDSLGDLYYRVDNFDYSSGTKIANDAVYKVNTQDPSSLTAERVSSSVDDVLSFAVDNAGNVVYSNGGGTIRLRKINGGLYNLSSDNFWIGLDGAIYDAPTTTTIQKLSVGADGTVTASSYGTGSTYISGVPHDSYMFRNSASMVLMYSHRSSDQYMEIYNSAGMPKPITGLPALEIEAATSTANAFFVAGKDSSNQFRIVKIDPSSYGYTDLVTPGEYDAMYQMTVSADGSEVVFNALRLSDGKKILAKVATATKVVTVLNETMDTQIVQLVRVN